MKKNIFINACFLLFLLFCFSNSIEAVEPEIPHEFILLVHA